MKLNLQVIIQSVYIYHKVHFLQKLKYLIKLTSICKCKLQQIIYKNFLHEHINKHNCMQFQQ